MIGRNLYLFIDLFSVKSIKHIRPSLIDEDIPPLSVAVTKFKGALAEARSADVVSDAGSVDMNLFGAGITENDATYAKQGYGLDGNDTQRSHWGEDNLFGHIRGRCYLA